MVGKPQQKGNVVQDKDGSGSSASPGLHDILSYTEFFLLCVSAPVFFIIGLIASNIFPSLVLDQHIMEIVLGSQGFLVLYFFTKRNPNIEADLKNHETGDPDFYLIRMFTVFATIIGPGLFIWLPLYTLFFK